MGSGLVKESMYETENYEYILNYISLDNMEELRNIFLNHKFNFFFRFYPFASNITLLHFSVMSNAYHCTKFLLSIGLDPNEKDNYGWTPLHYAAKNNNLPIFSDLLSYRADESIVTKYKDPENKVLGKYTAQDIANIHKSNYIINYYNTIVPILKQVRLRDI